MKRDDHTSLSRIRNTKNKRIKTHKKHLEVNSTHSTYEYILPRNRSVLKSFSGETQLL